MQRQASPAPPSPSAPPGFTIPSAFPDVLKDLNREVLRSQPADLLQFCANYFQRRLEQERLAHRQALGHSGDAHAAATATTVASAPHAPSARPDATTSSTAAAFAPAPAAPPPPANPFAAPQEARLGPDDRAEPIMDPFAGPSPFAAPAAAGSSTGGPQPASPSHRDASLPSGSQPPHSSDLQQQQQQQSQQQQRQQQQNHQLTTSAFSLQASTEPLPSDPESDAPEDNNHDDDDEDDDDDDDEDDDLEDTAPAMVAPQPSAYNRGRRTSVSAESMAPTLDKDFVKIVIPKSDEHKQRIKAAIQSNFLFRSLDEEQYTDVVNAMAEKRFAAGDDVILQGGIGDYFYVVETGTLDVFVARHVDGQTQQIKVTDYGPGGSFGELALMYNAPRAATVRCTSDCVLWALDRVTFRRILMENTSRKRRMYEGFLEEVPLLVSLEPYERHKIADALESVVFSPGDVVIKQGDIGDAFYIVESGEATVSALDDSGKLHQLTTYHKGDYFGELALLYDDPRRASVTAATRLKCATLNKKAFVRLLGPVVDIIRRNADNYKAITADSS